LVWPSGGVFVQCGWLLMMAWYLMKWILKVDRQQARLSSWVEVIETKSKMKG